MTGDNCVKNCGGRIEEMIISKKHITERIVIPTMKPISPLTTPTTTTTTSTITTTAAAATTTATLTKRPKAFGVSGSLKRRKLKRVRIPPGEGHQRARQKGGEPDSLAQASTDFITRARFRAPSRKTVSRMSSSTSLVSSSTETSSVVGRPLEGEKGLRRTTRNLNTTSHAATTNIVNNLKSKLNEIVHINPLFLVFLGI